MSHPRDLAQAATVTPSHCRESHWIHVNDWYGGIGAGAWEWVGNYGKGRLVSRGDRIESTVHVQLVRLP